MRLEWSKHALADLKAAGEYIAQESPQSTDRMALRLQEAVEYLREQPNLGRPGRLAGTRELVVSGTPFIVVYWVRKGAIQVLRILHHAQRWP